MTRWLSYGRSDETAVGSRLAPEHDSAFGGVGIAAEHVGDLGMARATDERILASARERQAVVVTLDSDFHALLASSRAVSPSVVRIRIEGLKGEPLASILGRVLTEAQAELGAGAVVSVTVDRIRVRRLPIGA